MLPYKVIILLSTCNRSNLIQETLDSIIGQTYTNWDCIVVDDHSTDNTAEMVKSYCAKDSRFTYFLKNKKYNKGLAGSRNFGLDIASKMEANYIQFFDDDDIMHPKKIALQIKPFLKNPYLNFTVCKFEKLFMEGEKWQSEKPIFKLDFPHLGDAIITGKMKMNSLGPLWRADFIQNFRFDEELTFAEEWELYTRIGYEYPENYEVVNKYLFKYRKHANSLTLGRDWESERIKTSAIIRHRLLEYLSRKKLHTKGSILFFANTFLLYSYQPNNVKNLICYVREENKTYSRKLIYYLQVALIMGKFYRKALRKLAAQV